MNGLNKLGAFAERVLADEAARGRSRRLRPLPETQKPWDLTHNDYLGLGQKPELRSEAWQAARAWPFGAGASRLLGGEHRIYGDLEARFADWKGTESSLYFPSGYAANEALLTALAGPDTAFFSDQLNHASLIDGLKLAGARGEQKQIFKHNDLKDLEAKLSASPFDLKIVLTESLFSMDGDCAPLVELLALCDRHDAVLLVDEAHALGVFGYEGRGLVKDASRVISVNPCGKAMAASGAFVCGPRWLRDLLIQKARPFIFSTGPSPGLLAGLDKHWQALRKADDARAHLDQLASALRQKLPELGFEIGPCSTHIIPLIVGTEVAALALEQKLFEQGIHARAIRPPTVPEGACRVRLSLHAALPSIDPLIAALRSV